MSERVLSQRELNRALLARQLLSGLLDTEVRLSGKGETAEAIQRALDGTVEGTLKDGVFHAMLDLDGGAAAGGTDIESRSSDAIALALRAGAEIVAEEELLDEAGVEMAETEDDEVEKFKEFLDHVSADDFDSEADSGR